MEEKTLELNYKGFENYLFRTFNHSIDEYPGVQYIFHFDNRYGASIIKHYGSYGYENDTWELGVLCSPPDRDYWHLTYDTPIGDDVVGYLSNERVLELLEEIKNFKPFSSTPFDFLPYVSETKRDLETMGWRLIDHTFDEYHNFCAKFERIENGEKTMSADILINVMHRHIRSIDISKAGQTYSMVGFDMFLDDILRAWDDQF